MDSKSARVNSSHRTSPAWVNRLHFLRHDRLLVVIGDFDLVGVAIFPVKTDSQLIVDSDAVLASAIVMQPFQTIARNPSDPADRVMGATALVEGLRDESVQRRRGGSGGDSKRGGLAAYLSVVHFFPGPSNRPY